MVQLFIYIILFVLSVIFHDGMLATGLKLNLSYTYSMILPYVIEFILVCLVLVQVNRLFLRNVTIWLRRIVNFVVFGGLCGIAFAAHPIYEGDFNNEYNVITVSGDSENLFDYGLSMLTLPGCSTCAERLEHLNKMHQFYPDLPISLVLVYADSTVREQYIEKVNEGINVELFPTNMMMNTAFVTGDYPTMFYRPISEPNKIKRWSNKGFGSAAWDFIIRGK